MDRTMEHACCDAFADPPDLDSGARVCACANNRACPGAECPSHGAHSTSADTCGHCGPCAEAAARGT
jgi:hypothetical protein